MDAHPSVPLPRLPRALLLLAGPAILAVAIVYAFHIVFSRSLSQDEGYLMITIQSFLEGHALYDSVFTQYGPFYYFYEWLVRGLFALPLTHDATRLLCLVHWMTAASLLGVAAKLITRSVLAGLFVFMQAVVHLTPLASEPGHPQELVVLLLAVGMLVAAHTSQETTRIGLLAVLAAVLAFTKINVGIFFGFALLLTLRCQAKDRFATPLWTWLLAAVGALLPPLLMRSHLTAEWCRNYSLIMGCAVTSAFVLARSFSPQRSLGLITHFKIGACFLIPSVVILALVTWTGTSLQGLIDGLFITPLKMPRVALLPLPLSNFVLLNAAISLGLALAVALRRKKNENSASDDLSENAERELKCGSVMERASPRALWNHNPPESARGLAHSKTSRSAINATRWESVVLVLKCLFGLAGAWLFIGKAQQQIAWLLPWVWLVLVPAGSSATDRSSQTFARLFLVLTAAWQGLQAYPIAGTQCTTATFLLTLAFAVCLHDALSASHRWNPVQQWRTQFARLTPVRLHLAQGLGILALLYCFANVWCRLSEVRNGYAALPPLDLPGSRFVRMDSETTGMYRELSAYLEKECDTFVTYPGINSLYFWTGKRPPTHLNSTGWGQLSHSQQTQILTGLRQSSRPLLVVVAAAAQSWNAGAPEPILPLVRCVNEDCREVKRIGRFILFVPKRSHEETAQHELPELR